MVLEENLLSTLRNLPKKGGQLTCASHSDADGIYSAALFKEVVNFDVLEFPEEFGDVKDYHHFCLDMRPANPAWKGYCFDHHPDHPTTREYHLSWEEVPTGLVIWHLFKNEIPRNRWWLVAGSLVGDGQPQLIPPEVFQACPLLLTGKSKIYEDKFRKGSVKIYWSPLYNQLSAPINAAARLGSTMKAYTTLRQAKTPSAIIEDELLSKAKWSVEQEVGRVFKDYSVEELNSYLILLTYDSPMNIQGYLASKLEGGTNKTVLVINVEKGVLSMRGDLCSLVATKLASLPWIQVSGHEGFMGGKIDRAKFDKMELIEVLRGLP